MAIIPMKRLQAVIPENQRDTVLKNLMALGCVEITETEKDTSIPQGADLLQQESVAAVETYDQLNTVKAALASMDRFCKAEKSRFFPQMKSITFQELDNHTRIKRIYDKARFINRLTEDIATLREEEEQIITEKLGLTPWQTLDIPLETRSSHRISVRFCVCPAAVDTAAVMGKLHSAAPESDVILVSSDREQHYFFLLYHRTCEQEVDSVLKEYGFSMVTFKDLHGTASHNIEIYNRRICVINEKRSSLEDQFQELNDYRSDLEFCFDALSLAAQREEMYVHLFRTTRTVFMEGWVPEPAAESVAKELDALGCAFEFSEPKEQEEPPVAFQNAGITAPFGIISGLYGTPRYRSIIDPTPYMAPFFFVFFGIMVADGAYGIILALTALWVLKRLKQDGFMRQLFVLVFYCGVSTTIWGILFGSWFGDIVPAVTNMFTGTPVVIKPLWFDPLKQPMDMLIFSFALGGLQILTGLGLSALRKIRSGQWADAIFDVGFWYMILIGLVMGLLKLPYGLELAAAGAAGVVLTAGRREKNPFKRILTGILSLYSVTGYLADVLSYSRLLALGLASSVIASVINAMGTIGGKSLGGIIALILIFIFGHIFNLAINLIGAYVHASRLQYVEFFSKFYEGGGKPFRPLAMDTKYVSVQKRE